MKYRTYIYWLGIRGIRFINHGEWSDPELQYKGKTVNFWDVEDWAYYEMKYDNGNPDDPEEFVKWCKRNAPIIKDYILELACA